jgi:hypothetical protein
MASKLLHTAPLVQKISAGASRPMTYHAPLQTAANVFLRQLRQFQLSLLTGSIQFNSAQLAASIDLAAILLAFSFLTGDLGAKRLGLLHALLPNVLVVALLVKSDNPNAESALRDAREAARSLRLELHPLKAQTATIWLLRRLGANTDTAGVPFNHLVGHREEGRRHVETCRTDSHLIQELSVA